MVQRLTIYGWLINEDPVRGPGSGVLIDLVYFLDDGVAGVDQIFNIIRRAGFKIVSKKIEGTKIRERDRITIEDWNTAVQNVKVGVERMEQEPTEPYVDRYGNYPWQGGAYP